MCKKGHYGTPAESGEYSTTAGLHIRGMYQLDSAEDGSQYGVSLGSAWGQSGVSLLPVAEIVHSCKCRRQTLFSKHHVHVQGYLLNEQGLHEGVWATSEGG